MWRKEAEGERAWRAVTVNQCDEGKEERIEVIDVRGHKRSRRVIDHRIMIHKLL